MAQVTIYLDDDVLALVKAATRNSGLSRSQWIADAIRHRVKNEWPAAVVAMAGSWPDFPSAEEVRQSHGTDLSRERI